MGVTTNGADRERNRERRTTRVELHVRSLSPGGCRERQAAVIERLGVLQSRGVIDGFGVQIWGAGVPVNGPAASTEAGRERLRQVARYEQWAREADVSLSIRRHEGASTITDERHRELRVPTMTLAEFRDSDLRCVTPHTEGETTRTVADRLRALERGTNADGANSDESTPTTTIHGPIERPVNVLSQ